MYLKKNMTSLFHWMVFNNVIICIPIIQKHKFMLMDKSQVKD